jgi:hypothetical protein
MFENRVLRRILGPKRDEETGECRRLHNEEPGDLYSSSNIIQVIKYIRMRGTGHVELWGRGDMHTAFWLGNLRERDQLEDIGADGRIILQWIFKKWDGEAWTGFIWLRIRTGGGFL